MGALLTRKEAAARLGITVMTLDAERNSGHLGPRAAPGAAGRKGGSGIAPSQASINGR